MAEDIEDRFQSVYLVRLRPDQEDSREFVGIFVAEGLAQLKNLVDECCPVDACEYLMLPSGGVMQTGRAGGVPISRSELDDVDLFRSAWVTESWEAVFFRAPDTLWTQLAPSTGAND